MIWLLSLVYFFFIVTRLRGETALEKLIQLSKFTYIGFH